MATAIQATSLNRLSSPLAPKLVAGTEDVVPAKSDALLGTTVTNILGLKSTETEDLASAKAETTRAAGYTAEAEAYGEAKTIREQNAIIAGIAGDIEGLQEQRTLDLTLG